MIEAGPTTFAELETLLRNAARLAEIAVHAEKAITNRMSLKQR